MGSEDVEEVNDHFNVYSSVGLLSRVEEVVPTLEYVLEPTYSAQWKSRRGKVKYIV